MGFFDWLFGRKQDPYANPPSVRQPSQPPASHASPRPPASPLQARGGPVPYAPQAYPNAPDSPLRARRLRQRQKRSKHPVPPERDQTLNGPRNPQTGQVTSPIGVLEARGGTRQHPDRHFNAPKVASHTLPAITDLDALSDLLGIPRSELIWLTTAPFEGVQAHYRAFEVKKKSGGTRLLCAPLPRLKAAQRALLAQLVNKLPVHEAAHGFRLGRGILSGASVHAAKQVLLSVDIKDFFPTFTFRRVSGYFRWMGYGRGIASTLALLTTARMSDATMRKDTKWKPAYALNHPDQRWSHPQLPQGAPTSPGIANAICWRMDKRFSALARKFGGEYTRYADDLTFSGGEDMAHAAPRLLEIVREIVRTEGLELNEAKTRVMRKGRQQRVTGVVVNEKTNVCRRDFDLLKAILHNCVKHGPAGQNRAGVPDFREHLRGRIAHVTHIGPQRGAKLKRMFEQIVW